MFGKFARAAAVALALVGSALPVGAQTNININTGGGGSRWAAIDLFSQHNFRGSRIRLTSSVSDLRWYGFSGRTQSFRAHGRWRLCSQTNYRGHCSTVRGNRSSLGATAGGNVRSARFLGN